MSFRDSEPHTSILLQVSNLLSSLSSGGTPSAESVMRECESGPRAKPVLRLLRVLEELELCSASSGKPQVEPRSQSESVVSERV